VKVRDIQLFATYLDAYSGSRRILSVTTTQISEVPLVGEHRALDLVNTVAPRLPDDQRRDYLVTPGDLLIWSQRTGLLDAAAAREVEAAWSASPAAGRRALTAVKEIREALYEILSACLGDTGISTAAQGQLDHISMAWASALPRARLMPATGGTGVARWAVGSPPALLVADRVAQDVVDLLCGIDVTRLGRCPVEAGGCGWLFLDHSRNRSRRWCAMEDCGSGAKARRLTERRRRSRTQ
jgi:predicted RNA-binding Zn ribbon-like protein